MFITSTPPSYAQSVAAKEVKNVETPPPYEELWYAGQTDALLAFLSFSSEDTDSPQTEAEEDKCGGRICQFLVYLVIFVIPAVSTFLILYAYL